MSKKLLSLLALLMSVVVAFCACAQSTAGGGESDSTQPPTVQTDPADPGSDAPTKPEPTEPEDLPADTENQPYMTAAQALYGASADGYGIWSVSMGLNSTKRLCVDSQGYIAFETDGSETDVAGVYNNAVLMKVNYDYYILRSVPSGEMLFDSGSNDFDAKIILPEHNGKEMFRDGYILAMRATEDYNGVSYEAGLLSCDGLWVYTLSPGFAFLPYLDADVTVAQLERNITYLGEGMIGLLCSDGVYRYFNLDTNAVTTARFPNNLSKQTIYDALDYSVHFIDGVSDPVYMNNNYYLFYADGRVDTFNVLWPKGLPRAEKCGNPYFDRATKTAYFLYDYGDGILVCDSNGKIIKKQEGVALKEYNYLTATRSACRGFASDGLARVIIESVEGTSYYAVLGIDGEFLFEPVSLEDSVNAVFDPQGYHINVESTAGYGYFAVIDNNGTLCYQSEYVNDFSVKNGVLRFKDDSEDVYVSIQVPALY